MATNTEYLPPHPDYSRLDLQRTLLADAPAQDSGDDQPYRLVAWMSCPPPGLTLPIHLDPRGLSYVHFARVHRGHIFDVVMLPVNALPSLRRMVLLDRSGVCGRYDSPFAFSALRSDLRRLFGQDTGDSVTVPVASWIDVVSQIDLHFRPGGVSVPLQVAL